LLTGKGVIEGKGASGRFYAEKGEKGFTSRKKHGMEYNISPGARARGSLICTRKKGGDLSKRKEKKEAMLSTCKLEKEGKKAMRKKKVLFKSSLLGASKRIRSAATRKGEGGELLFLGKKKGDLRREKV